MKTKEIVLVVFLLFVQFILFANSQTDSKTQPSLPITLQEQNQISQEKVRVEVKRTTITPTIDGVIESLWNEVAEVHIAKDFLNEKPTITAYWKALYDENNIYVLLNVEDDDHYPAWEAGSPNVWEYDMPFVYFDVNDELLDGLGSNLKIGHWEFASSFKEEQYSVPNYDLGRNNEVLWCYNLTGNNYVVEYTFPYTSLMQNDGSILDMNGFIDLGSIGFDITVADQDEGITFARQRKVWQNRGDINESWANMDDCGIISLQNSYISNAPISQAGKDQFVLKGSTVMLDGTASKGVPGSSLTYQWTAPEGKTLSSITSANPTFVAPEVLETSTYTFSLIVNDGTTNSIPDEVVVTVRNENEIPVANAGSDVFVQEGEMITFEGNNSFDPDGDGLTYKWESILDEIDIDKPNLSSIRISAPEVSENTTFAIVLMVNDGFSNSEPDTVFIDVYPKLKENVNIYRTTITPVIDSESDAIWNSVPPVYISKDFLTEKPTLTAYWKAMYDEDNIYVLLNVEDDDHYPAWEAGSPNFWDFDMPFVYFDVNDELLDGLGSNLNRGHWEFTSPFKEEQYGVPNYDLGRNNEVLWCYNLTGNNYVVEYAFPYTSLMQKDGSILDMNDFIDLGSIGFDVTVADQDEGITFARQRKVWQNRGDIDESWANMDDCGTITLKAGDLAIKPIADAGRNQIVLAGSNVTLNGSGNISANGTELKYQWVSPAGIVLNSENDQFPSFTAPLVSETKKIVFNLIVNDGFAVSEPDKVAVIVKDKNETPIADAGLDQIVDEGVFVKLSGINSVDPDGDFLYYQWILPENIQLNSSTFKEPVFKAPEVEDNTFYTFYLVVSDGISSSITDSVTIEVQNTTGLHFMNDNHKSINIYPNPAYEVLNISVDESTSVSEIVLYSVDGKLIDTYKLNNLKKEIDVSELKDGIYFIEIRGATNIGYKKFIKE